MENSNKDNNKDGNGNSSNNKSDSSKTMGDMMTNDNSDGPDLESGQQSHHREQHHEWPVIVQQVFDDDSKDSNDDETKTVGKNNANNNNNNYYSMRKRRTMFTGLIILVGGIASIAFLSMGIVSLRKEQEVLFERRSTDITKSIQAAWKQYEIFGLWVQESCFSPLNETGQQDTVAGRKLGICSRAKFAHLVESVKTAGLDIQAIGIIPNVSHAERAALEAESQAYYAQDYPFVDYQGFVGFSVDNVTGQLAVASERVESHYWPVHYMLPVETNEAALDLDLYSHPARWEAINALTSTWKPVVTNRIRLAQETDPSAYSVLSFHPGTKYKSYPDDARPTVFSSFAIRIPDLIKEASKDALLSISVAIFDTTDESILPTFMGGSEIYVNDGLITLRNTVEANLTDLEDGAPRHSKREIQVADRTWIVAVLAQPNTFEPTVSFVVLGGTIIMVATLLLAMWFYTNVGRMLEMQNLKTQMEAEKAAIILETARQQVQAERQLNEYISHEVRNPLCSAITALSFVSAATKEPADNNTTTTTTTPETKLRLQDDIAIIEASLTFIDELLRNLLDVQRAADKQMKITKAPTDIRQDVLEPVAAILHLRGSKVKVVLDCPTNLVCHTDRMRVKQIALNLSVNASKFVQQGYIRLSASVLDGRVMIYVEDSGPGIPAEKRNNLFAKFQESLDLLNQGTGIGLCLCKHLSCLLGGDIWLDETFDSGIEGCPGTRFVLDLGTGPMDTEPHDARAEESKWESLPQEFTRNNVQDEAATALSIVPGNGSTTTTTSGDKSKESFQLPEQLRVLFVDDDFIIRRLFMRAIMRIAPAWEVEEASNGETALQLTKSNNYDLIFIDQYMASVEKQLLGTETVRALRACGCTAAICGLSANDMEEGFKDAGATSFLFKPFPCEKEAFTNELVRILKAAS